MPPTPPTKDPTILELFAAFAAQLPLLTRDDLVFTVDAMRGSASFRRMMQHAREQAVAIGLPPELLERLVHREDDTSSAEAADEDDEPSSAPHTHFPLPAAG